MIPEYKTKEDDWDGPFIQLENAFKILNGSKIISAYNALLKTKEILLKGIEGKILESISKGETYIEILPSVQFISDENKQILKDAGYKVTEKQTMSGSEIKISWE